MTRPRKVMTRGEDPHADAELERLEAIVKASQDEMDALSPVLTRLSPAMCNATTHHEIATVDDYIRGWARAEAAWRELAPVDAAYDKAAGNRYRAYKRIGELRRHLRLDEGAA